MTALLLAGPDSKVDRYLDKLDLYLRDWCITAEQHRQFSKATCRLLNSGIRLNKAWRWFFYTVLGSDRFQPSTRILMLAAFVKHGKVLWQNV